MADSPYTSTLHLTRDEANDGLYFLSKPVITALKGDKADIKLYPVFYDKYYAVKVAPLGVNSLYVQDTAELTGLVQDPSKSAVVFFNLLNGITLPDADEDRFYNGVVSYSTLLNLYEGILDDQDIRDALLYDDAIHTLKGDIVDYLTLFHFARYEAVPRRGREISFKLDPYGNVIGSESAAALSLFAHMARGIHFNSLAFLTEVRRVLNLPPSGEAAR